MTDWGRVRYFTRDEFGHGEPGTEPDPMLVEMLDEARKFAGVPFVISSGLRTRKRNAEIGGAENSPHLTGHAVDIRCTSNRYRWHILDGLHAVGFRRLGIYDRHIHADNDPTKSQEVVWTGKSK